MVQVNGKMICLITVTQTTPTTEKNAFVFCDTSSLSVGLLCLKGIGLMLLVKVALTRIRNPCWCHGDYVQ